MLKINLPEKKALLAPVLFAAAPVLSIWGQNIGQISPWEGLRPLVVALLASILVLGVLRLILKDWARAALVVILFQVLFYSYGHLYHYFHLKPVFGVIVGRHRYMGPLWVLLMLAGTFWFVRKGKSASGLFTILNIAALGMLVLPLYQLGSYGLATLQANLNGFGKQPLSALPLQPPEQLPDIYYIILDTYPRDDVLQLAFDLNNTEFLSQLEGMGFYVARCSQSNYNNTGVSLSSSLNLNYLDALEGQSIKRIDDLPAITFAIRNNVAQKSLKALGYKTIAFETGYYWNQIEGADYYLTPNRSLQELIRPTPLETLFIESTAVIMLDDLREFLATFEYPYKEHIEREQFLLDELPKLPDIPGPKFAFVHVLIPHRPFVFTPSTPNNLRPRDQIINVTDVFIDDSVYKDQFADQVKYLNQRLIPILQSLQSRSKVPPIIILQGDHGPIVNGQRRVSILNAYYLPGIDQARLYPSISPVNTFRLVFNQYFGLQLPLLPDRTYLQPAQVNPVFEAREGCKPN
jgi:hypothetical protein